MFDRFSYAIMKLYNVLQLMKRVNVNNTWSVEILGHNNKIRCSPKNYLKLRSKLGMKSYKQSHLICATEINENRNKTVLNPPN